MSDVMEAQKDYFRVHLKQCSTNPGLHKHSMADSKQYLEVLETMSTPGEFMQHVQSTGNMVSTNKAEALDRVANRILIHEVLGNEKKLKAEEQRLEIIKNAQTHQELAQNLEAFETENDLEFQEDKACGQIASIFSALFELVTELPGGNGYQRNLANLKEYWKMMLETDTDCTWEKLVSYPPYRDRIVFTDAQLPVLEKIFREVL